jgi:hemophore-related protein
VTLRTMTAVRRGMFAAGVVGAISCTALIPTANSAPGDGCSASGLAAVMSSVTSATSDYLAAHPETNQALLEITRQAPFAAVGQFDNYFSAHPQEADELRAIQQPSLEYQNRCEMQVLPSEAFTVLQAL